MLTRSFMIHVTIGSVLLFSGDSTNTAHPCVPIVSALLKNRAYSNDGEAHSISHIIQEYAEESTVLKATSKKYYAHACTSGWLKSGSVSLYDRDGDEVRKIKINHPKGITFSPDGNWIIIMHTTRNPDPSLLFMGYLFHIVEVAAFPVADKDYVAYYPSTFSEYVDIKTSSIRYWPDLYEASIKKFYVNDAGSLTVELAQAIQDDNGKDVRILTEPDFIRNSTIKLQEKRNHTRWWKRLCSRLRR